MTKKHNSKRKSSKPNNKQHVSNRKHSKRKQYKKKLSKLRISKRRISKRRISKKKLKRRQNGGFVLDAIGNIVNVAQSLFNINSSKSSMSQHGSSPNSNLLSIRKNIDKLKVI